MFKDTIENLSQGVEGLSQGVEEVSQDIEPLLSKIKALENALLVKQPNVRCRSVSTIPQNLNMFVQEAEAQRNSGKKAWQYRMPAHLESKKWCKKYLPKHRE